VFKSKRNSSSDSFWKWFSKHEEEYYALSGDLGPKFRALGKRLALVHPDLSFEFSTGLSDGKREFTISADGFKDAIPYVIELVETAPLKKSKWTLHAFKQRSGLHDVEYNGVQLKPEHLFFTYEYTEHHGSNMLDLHLYIKELPLTDETIGAAFIFLDSLIGEYDVITKLRNIEFLELHQECVLPIHELLPLVDTLAISLEEEIEESVFISKINTIFKEDLYIYAILPEEEMQDYGLNVIRPAAFSIKKVFPKNQAQIGYVQDSKKTHAYEFYKQWSLLRDFVYSDKEVSDLLANTDIKNLDLHDFFKDNRISHAIVGPDAEWLNVFHY